MSEATPARTSQSDSLYPVAPLTVSLITILHAFTHAFQVLLIPLYLAIQDDLKLPGVKAVSLVVTLYNVVYWGLSFLSGILTDRFNRKFLLAIGLLGNSIAIALMGIGQRYEWLIVLGVVAGIFGTLFHPSANALASAHYPRSPGMMIGIIGIGAGLGFYFGPRFAGWRAQSAGWERPLIEMGVAGIVVAVLFFLLAREVRHKPAPTAHPPIGPVMRRRVLLAASVLGWRDFSSQAAISLASLYVQKALGMDVKRAGAILGTMMLSSIIINPLAVWASPHKRRLPALVGSLLLGGVMLALVPHVSAAWTLPVLAAFQACSLSSFALGDAGMLERVAPEVRGRVIGTFLTLAGTMGALGPYVMGVWVDAMGASASRQAAWIWPFTAMAALIALAAFSAPLIERFGQPTTDKQSLNQADQMAMMAGEM